MFSFVPEHAFSSILDRFISVCPTKKVMDWRQGFVKELNRSALKEEALLKGKSNGNERGCFALKKRFFLKCVV